MHLSYFGSLLVPFFLALVAVPLILRWSLKAGFVDRPSDSRPKNYAIPLGGGLVIFIGLIAVITILTSFVTFSDQRSAIGLLAGAVLIFLIGIYDDIYDMGVWSRMLGQIIAALIFLSFLERVPPIMSLPVYFTFGVVWIVGITNAFEFLDNMDGLCAGVAMTNALALGILFVLRDMPVFAVISFALAGGALGFLRYNLPPAGIYLGKTGSLLLGYVLSSLAVVQLIGSRNLSLALSPLLVMAYPIFDLTFVTVSRLNEGRNIYLGAKDHTSHKISFLGLTGRATVFSILSVNVMLVLLGVILFFIAGSAYQTLIIVALALILAFTGTHLYRNILYLGHKISFLLGDVVAINLAFILYLFLKYGGGATPSQPPLLLQELVIPLAWINVFWIMIYSAGGSYDIPVELKFKNHILSLLRLIIIGILIFAAATYKGGEGFQISLASLGLYAAMQLLINSIVRAAVYFYLGHRLAVPAHMMDAVIAKIHNGPVRESTLSSSGNHYNVKGFVGEPAGTFEGFLGPAAKLGDILRDDRVARVILDYPPENYDNLVPTFNSAFYMETRFLTNAPAADNLKGLGKHATRYKGIYLISDSRRMIFVRLVTRIIDFFLSAFLLVISSLWIVFTLVMAGYKNRKVIHRVTIVTRNGIEKVIPCSLDSDSRPRFRNPWGIVSVFKGDISFFGATITVKNTEGIDSPEMPGQWRKYLVKPGLFGPGYRGKTLRERFELDLEYIEKPSLFRDLSVIFGQMLSPSGIKVDEGA